MTKEQAYERMYDAIIDLTNTNPRDIDIVVDLALLIQKYGLYQLGCDGGEV